MVQTCQRCPAGVGGVMHWLLTTSRRAPVRGRVVVLSSSGVLTSWPLRRWEASALDQPPPCHQRMHGHTKQGVTC